MRLLPKEGHPDFDATDIIKFLDCIVVLFNTSVLVKFELYIDLYIVLTKLYILINCTTDAHVRGP